MGVKLIILLALLLGVLYCLHLLVKDYQAVTAPRLLRLLFKRDLHETSNRPSVRWRRILRHDAAQCARALYCSLGAHAHGGAPGHALGRARAQPPGSVREGFVYMLTLEPREEDASSREVFQTAFDVGAQGRRTELDDVCRRHYPRCPFTAQTLFQLIEFVVNNHIFSS